MDGTVDCTDEAAHASGTDTAEAAQTPSGVDGSEAAQLAAGVDGAKDGTEVAQTSVGVDGSGASLRLEGSEEAAQTTTVTDGPETSPAAAGVNAAAAGGAARAAVCAPGFAESGGKDVVAGALAGENATEAKRTALGTTRLKELEKVKFIGKIWQKSMKKRGWLNWPEGGLLDSWDKRLSERVFRLNLGVATEVMLSCPTFWFGVAVYVTCVIPVTFVLVAPETSWRSALLVCCPWLLLMVGFWPGRCMKSSLGGNAVARKLLEFKPGVLFAGPHLVMAAAWYTSSPREVVALFFCSYYLTSLAVDLFRGLVWRRRPLAGDIAMKLKRYDRAIPDASIVLHTDTQINLSFPSAYAATAAVWGTTLAVRGSGLLGSVAALLVMASSAFGNVYFRCHHLLDVVAGELIGVVVTLLVSRCGLAHWLLIVVFQCGQYLSLSRIYRHVWPQEPQPPQKQTFAGMQLLKEKLG